MRFLRSRCPSPLARRQLSIALAVGVAMLAVGCREHAPGAREVGQSECVVCHQADYYATESPVHEGLFPTTCADCHSTNAWRPALGGEGADASDPARDLEIEALIPRYSGTSIVSVTPQTETLTMPMRHASDAFDARANERCANCHSATGALFPGRLHRSLDELGLPQPAECADCHAETTQPTGFVGPLATDPARVPASGEMKHDAVAWRDQAPTADRILTVDCGTCHVPPSNDRPEASWNTARDGSTPTVFHAALDDAGEAQPSSCLDCHANSRPVGLIDASTSTLSAGLEFDHAVGDGMRDCAQCHTDTTTWAGGAFHQPDDPLPDSCTTCHEGQRPTDDSGWSDPDYRDRPFDYGVNAYGVPHGNGQDCVLCHSGPGTGNTETWAGGLFTHEPGGVAGTTCIACHASQRPDRILGQAEAAALLPNGFDHVLNGTGDCFGCHQATVTASRFERLYNGSGTFPGGDWADGTEYPGAFVSSSSVHINVTEIRLLRPSAGALVTGTASRTVAYYNGMLHTSSQVPPEVSPGTSTGAPDNTTCWHCHTSAGTTVTSFVDGVFHTALDEFRATPGGPVTPLPQPTVCVDCHFQMRPRDIVERGGSALRPMDHNAAFAAPATVGGASASSVSEVDCSVCHADPGGSWDDGELHARIGAATFTDCTTCHYPSMADAAHADVTMGTTFAMRHRAPVITTQDCARCHRSALGRATMAPAWALWSPGEYHPTVGAQPTSCIDCHGVSEPSGLTQSGVTYPLGMGGTASNGGQYMSHRTSYVSGRDCAACHMSDARATPAGWSDTTAFHALVSGVTTCRECHGLTNGGGATPGTNNNMPAGVVDTSHVTTASTSTGVAGRRDRIDHGDVNVTGRDCSFCHTQVGPGSGGEWAQAEFHDNFVGAASLVINTTTGRCDHCHSNLAPLPSFPGYDHSGIGATDCSGCHSLPGLGTPSNPNWRGATGGAPATITVGGFTVPAPPAPSPTLQAGVAGLPHPTGAASCDTCHGTGGGHRMAIGYDHASSLIDQRCTSCHEAGSDLVSPVWNGATTASAGAGDTRPFTLPSVRASFSGNAATETYPNHFYPADCDECHDAPSGVALGTTGAAYDNAWRFIHQCREMDGPATCRMCHTRTRCE